MPKSKTLFQSKDVNYPEKLYLAATWMRRDDEQLIFYTHNEAYITPDQALDTSKKFYKSLKRGKIDALPYIMLVTMNLSGSYPLKKDFWENPSFEYKDFDRMMSFINVITNPENYKVLVTPTEVSKNVFTAPIAFLKTAVDLDIELFMRSSDWYVDPTAKTCALYDIEGVVGINVLTREIVQKDDEEDMVQYSN